MVENLREGLGAAQIFVKIPRGVSMLFGQNFKGTSTTLGVVVFLF
jgi:hypothetical protein